jgi:hypothetical protein
MDLFGCDGVIPADPAQYEYDTFAKNWGDGRHLRVPIAAYSIIAK